MTNSFNTRLVRTETPSKIYTLHYADQKRQNQAQAETTTTK